MFVIAFGVQKQELLGLYVLNHIVFRKTCSLPAGQTFSANHHIWVKQLPAGQWANLRKLFPIHHSHPCQSWILFSHIRRKQSQMFNIGGVSFVVCFSFTDDRRLKHTDFHRFLLLTVYTIDLAEKKTRMFFASTWGEERVFRELPCLLQCAAFIGGSIASLSNYPGGFK